MVQTLIVGGIIFILTGGLGVVLGLRIQRQFMESVRKQQEAGERAEKARRQDWEQKQQREMNALKQSLAAQIEQLRNAYEERLQQAINHFGVELELARLPRVDETPILSKAAEEGIEMPAHWRPASLQKADLSHRDLSHRYLGKADLRGARLVGTNLSMADLSRACLAGADLTRANLTGANLSYADLRDANLSEATLLVADLHQTNLTGANLHRVYSLTAEQLRSAIRGEPSEGSQEIEETSPRLPAVRPTRVIPERPAAGSSSARSRPAASPVAPSQGVGEPDTPRGTLGSGSTGEEPFHQGTATSPELPLSALPSASFQPAAGEPLTAEEPPIYSSTSEEEESYFSPESLAYMLEAPQAGEQPEIPAWLKALETASSGKGLDFGAPPEEPAADQGALVGSWDQPPSSGPDSTEGGQEAYGQDFEDQIAGYRQEDFPLSDEEPWSATTWEQAWRRAAEQAPHLPDESALADERSADYQADITVPEASREAVAQEAEQITFDRPSAATDAEAAALPQIPETPFSVPTLDTLPFIGKLVDPLPPSARSGSESLLDPTITDHILDTQEMRLLKRQSSSQQEHAP
jgi:uncharacterized protein YjbI with pentapeptide repeats